jgi:hypothetical protein
VWRRRRSTRSLCVHSSTHCSFSANTQSILIILLVIVIIIIIIVIIITVIIIVIVLRRV